MADPANLAKFVARTLDNAEKSGAKQTWIDLVDHGGGDGGGLETHTGAVMSMPNMAKAIADGVALHAKEHPEDPNRTIDGIVANQCLMSTMGFADALSRVGVKYLAASPETMLSPGVPTGVADAIARNINDPSAWRTAWSETVMRARYATPSVNRSERPRHSTCSIVRRTRSQMQNAAIKAFNDAAGADTPTAARSAATSPRSRAWCAFLTQRRTCHGTPIARRSRCTMPSLQTPTCRRAYATMRAPQPMHARARDGAQESRRFGPFDGSSYADAVGPTIHAPLSAKQLDPWAPKISETNNAFYDAVDQAKFVRAVA